MALVENTEIGTRQMKQINASYEFWLSFEHDRWRLLSFTATDTARFGWLEKHNQQYTKYVTVKANEARFLLGVDPDVIDQFLLGESNA